MTIRPGRRAVFYAALGIPLLLTAPFFPALAAPVVALDLVLVVWLTVQALRLRRATRGLRLARAVAAHPHCGVSTEISFEVTNAGRRALRCVVRHDLPAVAARTDGRDATTLELPAYGTRRGVVPLRWLQRGAHEIGDAWMCVTTSDEMLEAIVRWPCAQRVEVFPAVGTGSSTRAVRPLNPRRDDGIRVVRHRGAGREFDRLREYTRGDPFRTIDWKATARRNRPITREYIPERSQNVVLAVDTSRTMSQATGGTNRLDATIRAALLTAHAALRQGDLVGLVTFDASVTGFAPPRRSLAHYRSMLRTLALVRPSPANADFRALAATLVQRLRKQALIYVLTDLTDVASGDPLPVALLPLRRRHRVVCVAVRDDELAAIEAAPADRPDEVYKKIAAGDILRQRTMVAARLRRGGVSVIECGPAEVAAATARHYAELKARSVF